MANNYVESSSFLKLNEEQLEKAKCIIEKAFEEFEKDIDYVPCLGYEVERGGIWFYSEEHIDVDALESVVRQLVEELNVEKPFFASWSYTCSKPRIDEFGGGAMCIMKGKDTIWVDAMQYVNDEANKLLEVK